MLMIHTDTYIDEQNNLGMCSGFKTENFDTKHYHMCVHCMYTSYSYISTNTYVTKRISLLSLHCLHYPENSFLQIH